MSYHSGSPLYWRFPYHPVSFYSFQNFLISHFLCPINSQHPPVTPQFKSLYPFPIQCPYCPRLTSV
ncbi:hypothetical protein PGB90_001507 [Kerria lacca]